MNKNPYKIRILDLILIAVIIILAGFIYFFLYKSNENSNGSQAVIKIAGDEYGRYSLNDNQTFEVKTTDGFNKIKIENGSVSVIDASCPDKLCAKSKAISKSGEVIVCLPNKMTIEITENESSNEIDAVVS